MKKQKNINYTLEQLENLATTPILFLQMIQANKWHRYLYKSDDLEWNAKVRFIRSWYREKTGQIT